MVVQFQGGSFDPGEVGDESIALQQSFTQQNRGWQRTAAMLKQNQDTQIRSAGKLWGQLGELAPSVNKFLQTKNVEWAKDQDAKGREFLYQNPVSKEEKDAYLQELKDIGKSAEEANKIASDWEAKGGDIWTSEAFRKLSPQSQVAAVQAQIASTMGTYNPSADPRVIAASSPTERVAAMAAGRHEFWKNFDGLDEKMVHLETQKKMEEIEGASNRAWNATRTKEIKEERRAEMLTTLKTGLLGENPAEAVMQAVNSQLGDFGGVVSESREDIMTEIVTMIENGELKRKDIDALEKSTFMGKDGTEKVFGVIYEKEFKLAKQAENNWLQKIYKVYKQEKERKVFDSETGWQTQHDNTSPEQRNNAFYDAMQKQHKDKHGVESTLINDLKAAHSVENIRYKDEEKEIKEKIAMNNLTIKDLDHVDGKLRTHYLPTAQAMEKKHKIKHENTEFLKKLPATQEFISGAVIGRDSTNIGTVGDRLAARYLKLSRQLDLAGVENPEQVARERVETWFRNTANNRLSGFKTMYGYNLKVLDPRRNDRARIAPLKANEREARDEMVRKAFQLRKAGLDNPMTDKEGNVLNETAFFTAKELTDMEDGYGEAGWYPDPKVQWLAAHYNVHPMHIINRSRKALNLPKLPENRDELNRYNNLKRSAKIKAAQNYLSGTDQGVCTTRMREQGGRWTTIDKGGRNVNVWQVCDEKTLNEVENASKESGIPRENIIAAMFVNRTDIGNNPLGLMDPSVMPAYNAALFATGDTEEIRQSGLANSMFAEFK